jgi:hypothetical protein
MAFSHESQKDSCECWRYDEIYDPDRNDEDAIEKQQSKKLKRRKVGKIKMKKKIIKEILSPPRKKILKRNKTPAKKKHRQMDWSKINPIIIKW